MKTVFTLIVIMLLLTDCDWIFRPGPCDSSGPVIVYKTRADYHDKLTVQLSKDKTRVTCYPGKGDAAHQKPIELASCYLLKRMCGDTFLSISIDDYVNSAQNFSPAEFLNLVLDTDPYTERYECCDCTKGDTAKINNLIRTNQLGECQKL